jgi:hypothetical protein
MRWTPAVIAVASVIVPTNAFAEDIETLAKQVDEEHAALSTQDCVTACKALASIRRAVDKLCGMDSGQRCSDARSKADDAQRRVQAACPDCQVAAGLPKDEERRVTQNAPTPEPNKALPAEQSRGGCASCSIPSEAPAGDLGAVMLAALVWYSRRRATRRSSDDHRDDRSRLAERLRGGRGRGRG